jgi:phosphatidylinositol N-acetylglucosaminyltransferase subunit A
MEKGIPKTQSYTKLRAKKNHSNNRYNADNDIAYSSSYHHRICFVCDFFYPKLGGVETHIWSLMQNLIKLGHKVVLVTHNYKDRVGVRYMTNALKVYYCPDFVFHDGASFPNFFTFLPLFRNILIRERIDIVHCHQASSPLSHQCLLHANVMGLKTVYTDHSLFSLNDMGGIHLNKLLKMTLTGADSIICVSHTCRENLVLRASLDARNCSVIPNAVDASMFEPNLTIYRSLKDQNKINIVVVARLKYRKGIDIIAEAIPIICYRYYNVNFIIGGDGPKRILLEEMIEKYDLHDRVELLGAIPYQEVPKVLNQGHIFLNCSLTESFCIAILEAASCGLYIVSTAVGGLPEVLPSNMITLSKRVNSESIVAAIEEAMGKIKNINPLELHQQVAKMYQWGEVAKRTVLVYNDLIFNKRKPELLQRLFKYLRIGKFFGLLGVVLVSLDCIFLYLLNYFYPVSDVESSVH